MSEYTKKIVIIEIVSIYLSVVVIPSAAGYNVLFCRFCLRDGYIDRQIDRYER